MPAGVLARISDHVAGLSSVEPARGSLDYVRAPANHQRTRATLIAPVSHRPQLGTQRTQIVGGAFLLLSRLRSGLGRGVSRQAVRLPPGLRRDVPALLGGLVRDLSTGLGRLLSHPSGFPTGPLGGTAA
ncbi:hypothetical protein [Micromonospora sp. KC723]|uniref:hypothetical protein n=1 Tax=Micromonospora sp. KC723 TaxID=2530381 RepID=UPI0014049486|nr:hypothetical protein [Micromonospora sp. KC723]